jgi:hypothetical protein
MSTRMCKDIKDGVCVEPTDRFDKTSAVIYMTHETEGVPQLGQAFVTQWIAEDVGAAAPKNTVIATVRDEVKSIPPGTRNFTLSGRLTKPTAGWPVGKYRVEVKLEGRLVTTARFTVV